MHLIEKDRKGHHFKMFSALVEVQILESRFEKLDEKQTNSYKLIGIMTTLYNQALHRLSALNFDIKF